MATSLYRTPLQNALQFTLDSQISAGASSLTLNSSGSGILQTPGVLVIDRVDSSGNPTATKREYFTFTGNSGTSVTGLVGGQAGSSQQIHAAGAIVEFIPDVVWGDAIYQVITREHDAFGQHVSLVSMNNISTNNIAVLSGASGNSYNLRSLAIASLASIRDLYVSDLFSASGASLQAFPMMPVWVQSGTVSGASANLGKPLSMPFAGKIQWIDVTTKIGSSGASLNIDITKNGTSVIAATGSTSILFIPVNGTFVSSASVATSNFVAGDVFNFSILGSGSLAQDLTIKFYAR